MATNTIAGVNVARISQLTIEALNTTPIPISVFTTDFSDEVMEKGESVTTRYPTNPSVVSFAGTRTASNSAMTSRTVTLSNYIGVDLGFTDKEMSFSDIQLSEMFIKPAITAIYENIFANVAALVTAANFSSNTVITAANFSASNVAGLCTTMNTSKIPTYGRAVIFSPTYADTLRKDSTIAAQYAYMASNMIQTGVVPKVHGFDMHEYNGTIPSNSENLAGIALNRYALLIAARAPAIPQNWYGKVTNIKGESGLTLQMREFYDGTEQRTQLCVIYGTQIGNPANLVRIKSAA